MADAQSPLDGNQPVGGLRLDDVLGRLLSEHHDLDQEIRRLSTLSYPSDQQQYQEHTLKKQKLALKDRIEALVRDRAARSGGDLVSR
jgi:uncharacterized protein YdcH (DUF465 family)